ncbi:hypothetical protein B0H16DRAFT_1599533 [Mycena metata]|uniref:Uncharacterized protein n=1 Tax=Mycena metata TaxID=1033252 RepID=A0AAD7HLS7_9AGAR|nr:hypothetical protein B0H16DRAFT_1599533 [Mycena metata]
MDSQLELSRLETFLDIRAPTDSPSPITLRQRPAMVFLPSLVLSLVVSGQFSSGLAQVSCLPTDKQLAELNVTTPQSSIDGFVTCTYAEADEGAAKLCYYFPNGTSFNGSSVSCPGSIRNFGFLCLSFDGSPSNRPDGDALVSTQNGTDPGVFTQDCYYRNNDQVPCSYSQSDGSRRPGVSSNGPITINSARLNSTGFNRPLNCTNQTMIGTYCVAC